MTYVYQPYPRSLYRHRDGAQEYNGVPCEVLTVDSEAEEASAKADGWLNAPAKLKGGDPSNAGEDLSDPHNIPSASEEALVEAAKAPRKKVKRK